MEVVRHVGNWQKDRGENHPGNGEEGTISWEFKGLSRWWFYYFFPPYFFRFSF